MRIDALESMLRKFGESLGETLTNHLRGPVQFELDSTGPMKYGDFMGSRPAHTCLGLLRVDPPGVQAIIDFSPTAIFPIIDRLLGGDLQNGNAIPARPLTQIEQALAAQIIERAAGLLADTFSGGGDLEVSADELIAEPARLRIMPADETIAVAEYAVRVNEDYGTMNLAMPQPLLQHLLAPSAATGATAADADARNLHRNILGAAVELRALLAETKLRLSDVLSMQVGDIITTDSFAGSDVPLQVQGSTRFAGQPAQLDGKLAIEITRSDIEASGEGASDERSHHARLNGRVDTRGGDAK